MGVLMPSQPATHSRPAPGQPCPECGTEHLTRYGKPSCMGHRRNRTVDGQRVPLPKPYPPCRRDPVTGAERCIMHGATKATKAAGERRMQQAAAQALVVTLGEPIDDGRDYSEIIGERVAMRRGHVAWLLARVRTIEPEALAWGLTKRKTAVNVDRPDDEQDDGHERRHFAGTDEGDTLEAKPNIWYGMYVEAARELEKLCIEAIRVGVEVRRQAMDERQADQWVRMLDGMIVALGHDPNAPETAEIVARHLALVA